MTTHEQQARAPRRTRRWLAALAILPATGVLGAGVAQAAPAAGNARPYALGATALLGQDGTTQLGLTVTSSDATYAVPSSLKHVQLKSFDLAGELVFTKNTTDVATPGGTTTLSRTDLQAGQPLKVQAQAQTGQTKNTQVIEATTQVKRRPDLTVVDVSAPAQVAPGAPIAIGSRVSELNGDLGATGTVTVSEGTTSLDDIDVSVAAGQSTNAALAVVLTEPGTHTLTVSVGGVVPGEWDTTNNTATVVVEVIQPMQTLNYSANYWNNVDYEYHRESSGGGYYCGWYYGYCGPHSEHRTEQSEWLQVSYWTNETISSNGSFDLTITTEAGTAETVHATGMQNFGNYWYWSDPATGTNVQVQTWSGNSNVYVWHNAGHWAYSDSYCDYWYGCSTYSSSSSNGLYWGATETVGVSLDLATTGAQHFGGDFTMSLTPYSNAWDYSYWDWYDGNVHAWGHQFAYQGWASGQTTL